MKRFNPGCFYQDFKTNADYMDAVMTQKENSQFIYKADIKDTVVDITGYPYAPYLTESEIKDEDTRHHSREL